MGTFCTTNLTVIYTIFKRNVALLAQSSWITKEQPCIAQIDIAVIYAVIKCDFRIIRIGIEVEGKWIVTIKCRGISIPPKNG